MAGTKTPAWPKYLIPGNYGSLVEKGHAGYLASTVDVETTDGLVQQPGKRQQGLVVEPGTEVPSSGVPLRRDLTALEVSLRDDFGV